MAWPGPERDASSATAVPQVSPLTRPDGSLLARLRRSVDAIAHDDRLSATLSLTFLPGNSVHRWSDKTAEPKSARSIGESSNRPVAPNRQRSVEATAQAPPSIPGSSMLPFNVVNSMPPIWVKPGGNDWRIRLPRLSSCEPSGPRKLHVMITPPTGNRFMLLNTISATRKPPSRRQFGSAIEIPSTGDTPSFRGCAVAVNPPADELAAVYGNPQIRIAIKLLMLTRTNVLIEDRSRPTWLRYRFGDSSTKHEAPA